MRPRRHLQDARLVEGSAVAYRRSLGGTSIADLAQALGEKRRLLARPRRK